MGWRRDTVGSKRQRQEEWGGEVGGEDSGQFCLLYFAFTSEGEEGGGGLIDMNDDDGSRVGDVLASETEKENRESLDGWAVGMGWKKGCGGASLLWMWMYMTGYDMI
ncbi:hypothetical protein An04g05080 [Aspergillus niger]|uniref:Uncharacterized protein n=2 Tax=Aspergillus niger TaxID=5061 RepID=A2QIX6_ASPNC|nr:hypothetical protein An04g05080 [Aspergillus niger]CAK38770.1 hypothetical protein An04g05080 [Aspergillus niger]